MDDDSLEDDENSCMIHHKILDLVCLEKTCEVPICSSCILFGQHKNHKYIELEKFFKNVDNEKSKLSKIKSEVKSNEEKFLIKNSKDKIEKKIIERKKKIEKEIEFNCQKAIRQIENKKLDLQKELNIYYQQLYDKLNLFASQCKDCPESNNEWIDQVNDCINQRTGPFALEASFDFMKKLDELRLYDQGKQIINAFSSVQDLLDTRVEQGIKSFNLQLKSFDDSFIEINKIDFHIEKDIKERFIQLKNTHKMHNNMNRRRSKLDLIGVDMNVPTSFIGSPSMAQINDFSSPKVLNEEFDPTGSNLMDGLNNMNNYENPEVYHNRYN